MSNSTSTRASTGPPASPTGNSPPNSAADTSSPPATTPPTSNPPTTSLPTSSPPPPPPTTTTPTTSSTPPTTSTPSTTSTPPQTTVVTSLVTSLPGNSQSTVITTITSTRDTTTGSDTSAPTSTNSAAGAAASPGTSQTGGLSSEGKIAVAVVVPIAAVAFLVLAGIFFWRKRRARKEAEEQRRKEVEDYTYNPNADPTIPAVGAAGYEMREDGSSGYRGWGSTTLAGSTGRKASTTMSGGAAGGAAYSDATSPTRGGISDTRSGEPMLNDGTHSPEGEILGVMGPSAAHNRGGGDVHRGPSNASSSYSAAARSDGSGEGVGVAYGDPNGYNQWGSNNPYADQSMGSPQRPSELSGAPIIRDNPARRNTRIENPAHYPQQSAGISQNF